MAETTISAQDRTAIQDLMARYAWCLDRGDLDGLAAIFTPDGAIHSATIERVFEGTEGIKEFAANALAQPGFAGRQHHIHPLTIKATDGGYFAISYWMVVTWDAGQEPRIVALGYYRDTCVQVDGQWRLKKRLSLGGIAKPHPWSVKRRRKFRLVEANEEENQSTSSDMRRCESPRSLVPNLLPGHVTEQELTKGNT